jgi:alkanesulfonate monooxygenase SsuD/methylene tetrahydromethanopterin reductase-like flavin-dependent oxidoreductase (luciferase family)
MPNVELWQLLATPGIRGRAAAGHRAADEGWDAVGVADSQTIVRDPDVKLTSAPLASTLLKLATSVTNPKYRGFTVTASAIAAVQLESGGQAVLRSGRETRPWRTLAWTQRCSVRSRSTFASWTVCSVAANSHCRTRRANRSNA